MAQSLWRDESGFIVSAELVLIATILVIGLIVGMSEVQHAVVAELNDVADAIGSANQSYSYSGFTKRDGWGGGWGRGGWGWGGGVHAYTAGSFFVDVQDECDLNQCMLACNPPVAEAPKVGAYGGYASGGYSGGFAIPPAPVPGPAVVPAPAIVPAPVIVPVPSIVPVPAPVAVPAPIIEEPCTTCPPASDFNVPVTPKVETVPVPAPEEPAKDTAPTT
jgi:hypothetical protein